MPPALTTSRSRGPARHASATSRAPRAASLLVPTEVADDGSSPLSSGRGPDLPAVLLTVPAGEEARRSRAPACCTISPRSRQSRDVVVARGGGPRDSRFLRHLSAGCRSCSPHDAHPQCTPRWRQDRGEPPGRTSWASSTPRRVLQTAAPESLPDRDYRSGCPGREVLATVDLELLPPDPSRRAARRRRAGGAGARCVRVGARGRDDATPAALILTTFNAALPGRLSLARPDQRRGVRDRMVRGPARERLGRPPGPHGRTVRLLLAG